MVVCFDGSTFKYVASDEAADVWVLRSDAAQGDFAGPIVLVVRLLLGDAGGVGLV